ncbi:alpha-mannosidase [Microbacterium sp. ASV49]|uniref:Glycoside hydrolase family 38 C-terminal domain-containing protein n=1 Tax=Microbacterium candidum TaxID=3041922 RepID=A0ABT7N4B8_9MICO|nr:glycoside hydrolase family 38 C-terminal domain-containing protein [Microbacterium sp. ASV49]MDL9981560.1 glycoside hydrolase family 38 C-terminal domain-containing protein [Microbacterium sp. ASV49]
MFDDSALVLARIDRFLRERVAPGVERAAVPLEVSAWLAPDEPVPFSEAVAQEFAPFAVGTAWGKPWGTTWFRLRGQVPEGWTVPQMSPGAGQASRGAVGHVAAGHTGQRVELAIDLGFQTAQPGFQAEGLVFTPHGRIVKALEPRNTHVPVCSADIDIYVEAASNPDIAGDWTFAPSPLGDKTTAGTAPLYVFRRADIVLRSREVWELAQDAAALRGLYDQLPATSPRAAEILRALERAVDATDPHDVAGTASAARAALAPALAAPANASAHRIAAVGHAHIDSAWLWPTRETVRKCARTFSNVLDLMDADPRFTFACSSAQQYAWIEERYPDLFARLAERVAEGRFVPVGGMWVESDTNLPGGEALVRQFVRGQRYFERAFGRRASVGWLPDSFGYTGALPQILEGAGLRSFLTQKISWNETNRFPHHTFEWEGIDGTRVFTHFPPVDTYSSDLSAADLARAERQYAEKGAANSSLVPFGFGDGGGGPTREMLAAAARTESLEGSPRVELTGPEEFFESARAEYPHPPVWAGELYLEFHRGTYTSQARTKRGNRRCEHLLREAELWATTAHVRAGFDYPYDVLDEAWRVVLLQQFHDILPGSSIAWVHREAEAGYARVEAALERVIEGALEALEAAAPEDGAGWFNASPFAVAGVPALGAGAAVVADDARLERDGDRLVLSTDLARFVLDASGRIVSAVDAATGREAIAPGEAAGELQVFRDTPAQWDAWDVDENYRRHGEVVASVVSLAVTEDTPHRVAVQVARQFGDSRVLQEFAVSAGSARISITTEVDWHERQRLLKLAFPLDIHTTTATSEVQFGHVVRPITRNTSWDEARFETSAHRWVHVGEPGFGAAVANDASYGHDVTRHARAGGGTTTLVRQSLLRAPLFPDPEADQGAHVFRSTLTVGAGIPEAVAEGYRLNLGRRTAGAVVAPIVRVDGVPTPSPDAAGASSGASGRVGPGVLVESVKLAEDRSGDLVVRLYEAYGRRAEASIVFDADVVSVVATDLLEDPVASASDGSAIDVSLRPFQIVTLRARRA